jgi:hypothetical protein
MNAVDRWKALSPRTRRLIIAAAAVDTGLKAAALIDLRRRPASQIRGPKALWAPVVAIVNSAGAIPIAYFAWGRRRSD